MQRLSTAARSQTAAPLLRRGALRTASSLLVRGVAYDTGDKKGKVMSLEEEQRIAAEQYKDQQKLTPKLDDDTVQRFREPWQSAERRESEDVDLEGMPLSKDKLHAIGEVMEGAAQALEGAMPLKRKDGSEIKADETHH